MKLVSQMLLCVPLFVTAHAQSDSTNRVAIAADSTPALPAKLAAGEQLDYAVSFGPFHVGSGRMVVVGLDTIGGHTVWHAVLTINGGIPFFHVADTTSSWFDTATFVSRRFVQHINEGRYHVQRDFRINPEHQFYIKNNDPPTQASADPLDDVSMIYFVRTLPMTIGARHEFRRYFQPEGNPVVITVVRRDSVHVDAGAFATVVVEPTITTSGIFSQDGRAQIWLSDDTRRLVVQLKSHLSFGSLNLYLTHVTPGHP